MTKRTLEEVRSDPIFQQLNPEGKHFLSRHLLTPAVNPFAEWCDIWVLTPVGIQHLKTIPAFLMLLEAFKAGKFNGIHTLVVPSSGNTADAVIRLAKAYGLKVIIVLLGETPPAKKGNLSAQANAKVIEVPRGVEEEALEQASHEGCLLLDQYTDDNNVRSHVLYTGPETLRVTEGYLDDLAVAEGSGGTITGSAEYLKRYGVRIIGSRPKRGVRVPGTRDADRMAAVSSFAYEVAADVVIEGTRWDSFVNMRRLWGEVEPRVGPSAGLAFYSLKEYLGSLPLSCRRIDARKRQSAFLVHDLGYFYPDYTASTLDEDEGVR